MSTENNTNEKSTQTSVEESKDAATKTYTEEAYLKVLSEKDQLKSKLRKLEADTQSIADIQSKYDTLLLEKSKLHEDLTQARKEKVDAVNEYRNFKLDSVLSTALDAAGAKSKSTVLKLLDKNLIQFDDNGEVVTDSVVAAIQELQKTDSILFGDIKDPKSSSSGNPPPGKNFSDTDAKRAGQGDTKSAYMTELAAAKTKEEYMAVAEKYGIIS